MATPDYQIFYGKYPDNTPNEIPTVHIKTFSGLKFSMEAGKPGEPKVDGISFTLQNFDHNGNERYDDGWFDSNSRSKAEGGLFPGQLFFNVQIPDTGAQFAGVLDTKKYSAYRNEVTVDVKSLLELTRDNNLTMLQEINLGQCEFYNPLRNFNGTDLRDDPIHAQYMVCSTTHDMNGRQRLIEHFGYTDIGQVPVGAPEGITVGGSTYEDPPFYEGLAFVKVNNITLLVTLQIGHTGDWIDVYFWHMNNDNITVDGGKILQRGRFFGNEEGDDLQPIGYNVTLYLPNVGYTPTVMINEAEMSNDFFIGGIRTTAPNFNTNSFSVRESAAFGDYIDLFDYTVDRLKVNLFNRYYFGIPDNFTKSFNRDLYAFWADLIMFGWDDNTSDLMVNLAMAVNSYLFMNEQGKIVFQDRIKHTAALPGTLPDGTFEVQLKDIKPLGSQDNSYGFDSFSVEYTDRIPVNNVEAAENITISVDADGIREEPALRNTNLTIAIYRTDNLGVPPANNGLPMLRRTPVSSLFPGPADMMTHFIEQPEQQTQHFAKSLTYPLTTWKIQWDMTKYPAAGIGKYFWLNWGPENRVYLIRQITHDPDRLLHKMEVQQVGVWNG